MPSPLDCTPTDLALAPSEPPDLEAQPLLPSRPVGSTTVKATQAPQVRTRRKVSLLYVSFMAHVPQASKYCVPLHGRVEIGALQDDADALTAHRCVLQHGPAGSRLLLPDDWCSRTHAELLVDGSTVKIVDRGSTNGTFLNGRQLPADQPVKVPEGAVIRIGRTFIMYGIAEFVTGEIPENPADLEPTMSTFQADLARACEQLGHSTVLLILGETGTGKEHTAAEAHRRSGRPGRFETIDSAAIPEKLETELFGSMPGAFPGARNTAGFIERGHRGTCFFDEVGNLVMPLQEKLLRVVETRVVRRVGGTKPIEVDVSLVFATNANLATMAKRGQFRKDLLHRIRKQVINLPPLRERREDLGLLVASVLRRLGKPHVTFRHEVVQTFIDDPWPGNVRELVNALELALRALGMRTEIALDDLHEFLADRTEPDEPPASAGASTEIIQVPTRIELDDVTREQMEYLLRMCRGVVKHVAFHLGRVNTTRLYDRFEELGLVPDDFRPRPRRRRQA